MAAKLALQNPQIYMEADKLEYNNRNQLAAVVAQSYPLFMWGQGTEL